MTLLSSSRAPCVNCSLYYARPFMYMCQMHPQPQGVRLESIMSDEQLDALAGGPELVAEAVVLDAGEEAAALGLGIGRQATSRDLNKGRTRLLKALEDVSAWVNAWGRVWVKGAGHQQGPQEVPCAAAPSYVWANVHCLSHAVADLLSPYGFPILTCSPSRGGRPAPPIRCSLTQL